MGNRCGSCNKFVGIEQADPEVESLEIDEEGIITGQVRLVLACADCGDELRETYIDFEESPEELATHISDHKESMENAESLEIEEGSIEYTDRMQTTDSHGKPIKRFRYMRHFYGFNLDAKVTCTCGKEFEISIEGEEQASAFDDLY